MSDKINDASSNGREQFNNKSNPQPEQQGIGSEQVKNTKLYPAGPKPPGNVRSAQDRLIHQEGMQKDDNQAAKTNDKAMKVYEASKARTEQQKQLDLDKDKEK